MNQVDKKTTLESLNLIMEKIHPGFSRLSLGDKTGLLVNLMQTEKEIQHTFSEPEIVVISKFPDFKEHYQTLIDKEFMKKDGKYLKWLKSKQCLAEYFGNMSKKLNPKKNVTWGPVHILFSCKQLNTLFSVNGNVFKKISKDYQELKTILGIAD